MYLNLLRMKPNGCNNEHTEVIYNSIQSILSKEEFRELGVKETLIEQAILFGNKSLISKLIKIIEQVDPTFDATLSEHKFEGGPTKNGKQQSTGKKAKSQTMTKRY